MVAAHLFAHCQEALCVAEDTAVAFFAPKTLKKFRVERLNGARICGLFLQSTTDGFRLHVIDVEATWHVLTVKNVTLLSSAPIRSTSADVAADAASQKPKIASRRGGAATGNGASEVLQCAQFHEVDSALHAVLLYPSGVYEVTSEQVASGVQATRIMHFTRPLQGCQMAVGRHTGLVVVGQSQQRWLQFSLFSQRDAHAKVAQRRVLSIAMQTVACSPRELSVAVGGTRGELCVYPEVVDSHFFSDHWHHTALTALCFSADGTALYTGARESVLLLWNLSTYTFKKVTCNLGPISCVVPSASSGHTLLLACNTSTLAIIDALQMHLQHSVEGIEWSAGEACSGLVVDQWQGEPAVVLTGLPNVLRICDPLTQQALYSLHISSQMETVPSPPRHGIQFAGLFREGRLLVTYETFAGSPLPSLLRFWSYDARLKRHVESQVIYAPHTSEVLALNVDKANNRVFTMCAHALKCWEEVVEDANDAFAARKAGRSWRNQSTTPTPSQLVRSLALSPDGSLCFVADDCVHVYDVSRCAPGIPWPALVDCTQTASTAVLEEVVYMLQTNVVVARNADEVFLWSLSSPDSQPVHYSPEGGCTALCSYTDTSVLIATRDSVFVELDTSGDHLGQVKGKAEDQGRCSTSTGRCVQHMSRLSAESQRIAVVDSVSGFRVLNVSIKSHNTTVEEFSSRQEALEADKRELERASRDFGRYFAEGDVVSTTERGEVDLVGRGDATAHVHMAQSARYLRGVLGEPAYTVPPMSSVLSSFLQRRAGATHLNGF